MKLGDEVRKWDDGMKLVWESIQVVANEPSDSLHDILEPLSDRTKKWDITREWEDSKVVRSAVESIF